MTHPNTGMVVISDLVDNINDIHPQNKRNVAMPNLFSKAGLPVNLFRTDEWTVNTETIKK